MKKDRCILSFILCTVMLLQISLGAWAAETEGEAEEVQETEASETVQETDISEEAGIVQETGTSEETDAANMGEISEWVKTAQNELKALAAQEKLMALVYLCDSYQVKRAPDAASEDVVQVSSGTTVFIEGVGLDEEGQVWYQVSLEHNGVVYGGYVERSCLAYSNEHFLNWESNYFPQIAMYAAGRNSYPDVEQFPASYVQKLMVLKSSHPNWIFVRQNIGLDWQVVVKNENEKDRSLISGSMEPAYRGELYGARWYYASKAAVEYYLDPRNFLDETRIFQFEQLTYNSSYHSREAVQNILNNTFMKGTLPDSGITYADAFFDTGVSLKVSPFHLACRVYQEQGEGTSALISGKYDVVPEYRGYYNYYNIGASGTTTKQIVESGLAKAVSLKWNTPYASIKGGAAILSKNYILRGQDTLYLQKFDVDSSDGTLFTHQYMQNVMAPCTESSMVKKAYTRTGSLDSPFVFKIPVYNNMPAAACGAPSAVPVSTATPGATAKPTVTPTAKATATPTAKATATPTAKATATPTAKATATPIAKPTVTPTAKATATPTAKPTATPTTKPTAAPTAKPTAEPTAKPVVASTAKPTAEPTAKPAVTPTAKPTAKPAAKPAVTPTAKAAAEHTAKPAVTPTAKPTAEHTAKPAVTPTAKPTATPTARITAAAANTSMITPVSKVIVAPEVTQEPDPAPAAVSVQTPVSVAAATAAPSPTAGNAGGVETTAADTPASENERNHSTSQAAMVAAVTPKPQTASEEKNVLIMDMSGTEMIYKETLQRIREQGRKVILKMNEQISWSIDGSRIETENPGDINLSVLLGESGIPERELKLLAENETYVELSLAHEGAFGFPAVLSVQLDNAQPGQYANLFYYNESTESFEYLCASQIGSLCRAEFEFNHASDYVIIISDEIKEGLLAEKAGVLEETWAEEESAIEQAGEELPAKEQGRAAGIIAVILLASLALGIGVYLIFKRN